MTAIMLSKIKSIFTIERAMSILKWKYALLAFAAPVIAACIGFMRLEAAPFGENSLISMDLFNQYYPMYSDFTNHRLDMSFFYSWNGALGFNSFAQSGYYGNSLFLLIFLFLKRSSMVMAIDIIMICKFGLASLSCFFFLKYKFKKEDMLTVGFSVAYALCAYMITFITQLMWTDLAILLPLLLIGFERMLLMKKPLMYCLFLAFALFTNFYIGFSVCIFLMLYFLIFAVDNFKNFSFDALKTLLRQAKYFAGFSIIAAGLAAFMLLPTYNALNLVLASEISFPEIGRFYHPLRDYLSNMLPFSSISLDFDAANVYGGSFIILFLPMFIFGAGIKLRRRIAYSALIVFFYFSMNYNMLDYIWHGFHIPNHSPGRWTFMFTLTAVIICCEAAIKCEWKFKNLAAIVPWSLLVIYIGGETVKKHETNSVLIAAAVIFVLGALMSVSAHFKKFEIINKIAVTAIGAVIIAEAGVNAAVVLSRDSKTSNIEAYQFADDKMAAIVKEYDSKREDFYRMELTPRHTNAPGMNYNYKGIGYYSSTMTGAAYNFFKSMGYQTYAYNVSTFYFPDYPILNSMLNIKYLVQRNGNANIFGFEKVGVLEDFNILQNEYFLPFAFIADQELEKWKPEKNLLENQNSFMRSAANGENIYVPLVEREMVCENADITPNSDWDEQYYHRDDPNLPVAFTFKYDIPASVPVHMVHGFRAGEIYISVDGGAETRYDVMNRVINLGVLEAGSEILIKVSVNNVFLGVWGMGLYVFDEEAFDSCYANLSMYTPEAIDAGDTYIKCKINSPSGGLLYTSIPAVGWSLKCNGVKIDTLEVGEFLLAAVIPAGENELEFRYSVPGLTLGIIISFFSLCVLIFFLYRIKKQERQNAAPARRTRGRFS